MTWYAGQRVALNRSEIVVVERVTESGRARVGIRTFGANGVEIGGRRGNRGKIEALTPQIEAEIALFARRQRVDAKAHQEAARLQKWVDDTFGTYMRRDAPLQDIEAAERLVALLAEWEGTRG